MIELHLPPLRERINDVAELTRHFLQSHAVSGLGNKTISPQAIDKMRQSMWPGNVRALENFVRQLVVLCPEDEISADFVTEQLAQLPSEKIRPQEGSGQSLSASVSEHLERYFNQHGDSLPPPGLYNRVIREVELPLIALTLSATRGNQIKAAELLGINRNTLRKKIQELDIVVTRGKKMM